MWVPPQFLLKSTTFKRTRVLEAGLSISFFKKWFLFLQNQYRVPNYSTYSYYKVSNLRELLVRFNIVLVLATENRHEVWLTFLLKCRLNVTITDFKNFISISSQSHFVYWHWDISKGNRMNWPISVFLKEPKWTIVYVGENSPANGQLCTSDMSGSAHVESLFRSK